MVTQREPQTKRIRRKPTTAELWVFDKFESMPLWVRVVTYLLFVVVVVHTQLRPTILQGDLHLKDGTRRAPAVNYSVTVGDSSFRVNSAGKWVATTTRAVPGSVTAFIGDPDGVVIGVTKVPLPIPIWSALFPDRVFIDVDRATSAIEVQRVVGRLPLVATLNAAGAGAGPAAALQKGRRLFIAIKRISVVQVSESPDEGRGELFFVMFVNSRQVDPLGVPSVKYPNTHLPIARRGTVELPNTGFVATQVPDDFGSVEFLMRVYDYDSCAFCRNPDEADELGILRTHITPQTLAREVELSPLPSRNAIATGNTRVWIEARLQ
jgi:hypothetical protein